jgi:hypothetical protein
VFLVTKPLQLIVSEIIKQELNVSKTCLAVVDEFAEAEAVFRNISEYNAWGESLFFKDRKQAFSYLSKHIEYKQLFVDTDVGPRYHLRMLLLKLVKAKFVVSVYEEGIGSYRTDLFESSLKNAFLVGLGVGSYFGHNYFTERIYLFDPERYRKIVGVNNNVFVEKILETYIDFISRCSQRLEYYFDAEELCNTYSGNECAIYLTGWEIDRNFSFWLSNNRSQFDTTFVKPHPQIKTREEILEFDIVIPGRLPVELFLSSLSQNFQNVTVYHHNSSVAHYLKSENLNFVEI